MVDPKVSMGENTDGTFTVFFRTAGQQSSPDYAWRGEDGISVPSELTKLADSGEGYLDTHELSWIVVRVRDNQLLLLVDGLPSHGKDPSLRRIRNGFAIELPGNKDDLVRAIMIELLTNSAEFAEKVDKLVSIDPSDRDFGWAVSFDDFRVLLSAVLNKHLIGHLRARSTPRLFRYDSPESRQIFVSELRARSLPSSRLLLLDSFASVEWIAICNPILTDEILNMQIWSVVTNQDDIPEAGFKAGRSLPVSLSREQLLIVGIALAAGIAAWLLLRRKI